jgi:broad specificity phosphatase PhoE
MVEIGTIGKKELLLYWVRHGERMDEAYYIPYDERVPEFENDPPLTEKGKQQASEAGLRIAKMIEAHGYNGCAIKFIASPLLRTLQTGSQV